MNPNIKTSAKFNTLVYCVGSMQGYDGLNSVRACVCVCVLHEFLRSNWMTKYSALKRWYFICDDTIVALRTQLELI